MKDPKSQTFGALDSQFVLNFKLCMLTVSKQLPYRYGMALAIPCHPAESCAVMVNAGRPHGTIPRTSIHMQLSTTIQVARAGPFLLFLLRSIVNPPQLYPPLFARVKEKVLQGQFHPIGGSWVENDSNMPSGEALVRQFLFGQRFFETRFGKRCETAWLPDSFGLTGALPQLIRGAGG